MISNAKSADDMLNGSGDNADEESEMESDEEEEEDSNEEEQEEEQEEENEDEDEEGEEEEEEDEEEGDNGDKPIKKVKRQPQLPLKTLYPSILYPIDEEEASANEAALESLGLLDTAKLNTVPIGSIERAERLTERKWKKLTKIESCVQAFLENGVQLPDSVLDEFIAPLWKEAPFDQVGFILVGFPNTEADIKYLMKNKYFPEFVYLLDCNPLVIRNRLLINAVDRWHHEKNPTGQRKKRMSENDKYKAKALQSNTGIQKIENRPGTQSAHFQFPYQTEGRPVIDEYEKETWTYDDKVAQQVTKALKHYHSIYSKDIKVLKVKKIPQNNLALIVRPLKPSNCIYFF